MHRNVTNRLLACLVGAALSLPSLAAFPVVESVATSNTGNATHATTMPATVNAGDLLIALSCMENGASAQNTVTDWTRPIYEASGSSGGGAFGLYYKVAVGDEDGTSVSFTTTQSRETSIILYRISGWYGSDTNGLSTSSSTPTATSDPPSVTASWGSDDNLFITFHCAFDDDANATAAPTNYSNLQNQISGGGVGLSASAASAERQLAASSDDPGVFTLDAAPGVYYTGTMVIRPATAGGSLGIPIIQYHMNQQADQ